MTEFTFPNVIKQLSEADIPFEGIRGWLSLGKDHQVVYLELEPIGKVARHLHGAQWEVELKGHVKN